METLKNFTRMYFLWCWDQIKKMLYTKFWPLTSISAYIQQLYMGPSSHNTEMFSSKNKNWHLIPHKGESEGFALTI